MTACLDCAATLGAKNKSGRCRSCLAKRINVEPAVIEARRRGIAVHYEKPGAREKVADRIRAFNRSLSPEQRAIRSEHGKRQYQRFFAGAEGHARVQSAEARRKRGASVAATAMAWCPPHMRDEYRRLVRSSRVPAPEARAIIERQIATDAARADEAERRRLAAMTSLERQLERMRNGARFVEVRPMPTRDLTFTPGGVATGML